MRPPERPGPGCVSPARVSSLSLVTSCLAIAAVVLLAGSGRPPPAPQAVVVRAPDGTPAGGGQGRAPRLSPPPTDDALETEIERRVHERLAAHLQELEIQRQVDARLSEHLKRLAAEALPRPGPAGVAATPGTAGQTGGAAVHVTPPVHPATTTAAAPARQPRVGDLVAAAKGSHQSADTPCGAHADRMPGALEFCECHAATPICGGPGCAYQEPLPSGKARPMLFAANCTSCACVEQRVPDVGCGVGQVMGFHILPFGLGSTVNNFLFGLLLVLEAGKTPIPYSRWAHGCRAGYNAQALTYECEWYPINPCPPAVVNDPLVPRLPVADLELQANIRKCDKTCKLLPCDCADEATVRQALLSAAVRFIPDLEGMVAGILTGRQPSLPYLAFHVRRGDKARQEAPAVPLAHYVQAAMALPASHGVRWAFLATDAVSVIPNMTRLLLPHGVTLLTSRVNTEALPGELPDGHDEGTYWAETQDTRFGVDAHVYADIRALAQARVMVGTMTSNIFRIVAGLRGSLANMHSVDFLEGGRRKEDTTWFDIMFQGLVWRPERCGPRTTVSPWHPRHCTCAPGVSCTGPQCFSGHELNTQMYPLACTGGVCGCAS